MEMRFGDGDGDEEMGSKNGNQTDEGADLIVEEVVVANGNIDEVLLQLRRKHLFFPRILAES
eukprot:766264-Hanusia_phi.AAC.4